MKACFVDNAEIPITCACDTGETYNCLLASSGQKKETCEYWQPDRAVLLCREILEDSTWGVISYED